MTDKNFDTPPTPQDVTDHFWEYFSRLREKNNQFARAVTSVDFVDGTVTVVIDPQSAGATREALYGVFPGSWGQWAATPVSFWKEEEIWLRTVVHSVRVEDVDGTHLGSGSTEQFAASNHVDNIRG